MKLNAKTSIRISLIVLIYIFGFESVTFSQNYVQYGKASFYAKKFNGRRTASGEIFNNNQMTAAHRTLPFNTVVRVTNVDNNKTVEVRINDRGPKSQNRVIDVSRKAAKELDIIKNGIGNVKVEVVQLYNITADSDSIRIKVIPAEPFIDTTVHYDTASYQHSNWYKVSVKDLNPAGFGIQVGSFNQYANMMKEVDTLQALFSYSILVQSISINNQLFYRVILGPFDTKIQAQQNLAEIRKKNIHGFIIQLKP